MRSQGCPMNRSTRDLNSHTRSKFKSLFASDYDSLYHMCDYLSTNPRGFVDLFSLLWYSQATNHKKEFMMEKLYENIKKFREALGLTQEELARTTGYSDRTSIAKIEAGKIDLSQSKLTLFAAALQTSPTVLLGWQEEEIQTIAAHHDSEDWTDEELAEIEAFKKYVKSKRNVR